ncbi:MAG: 3-dehydroquinate synthase [Bacteroidota bacterium]
MIDHEIRVDLGERSYFVLVGSGMLGNLASLLAREGISGLTVIITDRNVARRYLRPLHRHLSQNGHDVLSVTFPPGETQKSLKTAQQAYTRMLENQIGRTSTVIALGGGVIGDLAGFVAATYQRGIRLVHVPTSLLAQVDSSIGGKTGVNHVLGKNMIGAFHQPKIVVADTDVLRTLPAREIVCGLGEIIKYGVILDEPLFSFVEKNWQRILQCDRETVIHVVARCARLKADLVSRDEKESSVRVILNCGHTVGHALEAAGKYRSFKHGEAVLLGLAAESSIARKLGLLSADDYERIVGLIRQLPLRFRLSVKSNLVLSLIGHDKKARNGKNRFVLPVRIGETTIIERVEPTLIREGLNSLAGLGFGVSAT